MLEQENKNAPLLHVKNLRVSFKGEDKQYIETVKGITFDIPANTLYWEWDLTQLLVANEDKEIRVQPISKFQAIPRELNFVMDETVHTGPIATNIEAFHPWIHNVTVESIYRDEAKLWANKKSVNFIFTLQSLEHTISDNEALTIQNNLIEDMRLKWYHIRSI